MARSTAAEVDGTRARRPVGVTVLVVLGLLQGAALLAVGGLVTVLRDEPDLAAALELPQAGVLVAGMTFIGLGLARLGFALALGRGSEVVRSLMAAVAMFQTGTAVYSLAALRDVRVAVVWPLVLAIVELWLLYGSEGTQEFFRRDHRR
jgi:hypothetical protein